MNRREAALILEVPYVAQKPFSHQQHNYTIRTERLVTEQELMDSIVKEA